MTEAEVLRIHKNVSSEALKNQNFAVLEELYSARYMLVRSDGSVLNKQQLLTDLREQGLTFESIELQGAQVRIFDSAAILTGESRKLSSRNGHQTLSHFRLAAVYAQEEKSIRLVHFQSVDLPE